MQNKLTWRSKLSFGMGGFGKDLVYAIVSTYFMKYLTDVRLVDPMFVAVLFVVARIWDAFNDPFMGMIVDNTRSRWGKFRPWIFSSARCSTPSCSSCSIWTLTSPPRSTPSTSASCTCSGA